MEPLPTEESEYKAYDLPDGYQWVQIPGGTTFAYPIACQRCGCLIADPERHTPRCHD